MELTGKLKTFKENFSMLDEMTTWAIEYNKLLQGTRISEIEFIDSVC